MKERISSVEDSIKEIGTSIKENIKFKSFLTQNTQEIWDTMKKPNLKTIGGEEGERGLVGEGRETTVHSSLQYYIQGKMRVHWGTLLH